MKINNSNAIYDKQYIWMILKSFKENILLAKKIIMWQGKPIEKEIEVENEIEKQIVELMNKQQELQLQEMLLETEMIKKKAELLKKLNIKIGDIVKIKHNNKIYKIYVKYVLLNSFNKIEICGLVGHLLNKEGIVNKTKHRSFNFTDSEIIYDE